MVDSLREATPFYWLFERGATILLCILSKTMLAAASCYGPCSTKRAGYLDQVILLMWPTVRSL